MWGCDFWTLNVRIKVAGAAIVLGVALLNSWSRIESFDLLRYNNSVHHVLYQPFETRRLAASPFPAVPFCFDSTSSLVFPSVFTARSNAKRALIDNHSQISTHTPILKASPHPLDHSVTSHLVIAKSLQLDCSKHSLRVFTCSVGSCKANL